MDEAERLLLEAIKGRAAPASAGPDVEAFLVDLVGVYDARGSITEVLARQCDGKAFGGDSPAWELALCGHLYIARGDYTEALRAFTSLEVLARAAEAPSDPGWSRLYTYLSFLSYARNNRKDGARYLALAGDNVARPLVIDPLEYALHSAAQGYAKLEAQRRASASIAFDKALRLLREVPASGALRATIEKAQR